MRKSVMAVMVASAAITFGSAAMIVAQKDAVGAAESSEAAVAGIKSIDQTVPEIGQGGKTEEVAKEGQDAAEVQAVPETLFGTGIVVEPGARIAVVSKCVKGEFISLVQKGMEQAVSDANKELGYGGSDKIGFTMEGPKDELDIETQINTLDAVISENPDVLCMSIGDKASCLAQLEAAAENGIPVVVFDSSSDFMELVSGYRASDNLEIGRIGAEKLCEALGGTGTVAIIAGQEKTSTTEDRVTGFNDKLSDYPGVRVVETIYEDQVDDIKASVKELLQNYPDLSGVFCTRAEEADLYLSVEKGETAPVMVGVDGTKAQQEAIRNGKEYGCVSQDAWQIGYDTMVLAISLTDQEIDITEGTELLEPGWLDSANIDLEKNKRFLF